MRRLTFFFAVLLFTLPAAGQVRIVPAADEEAADLRAAAADFYAKLAAADAPGAKALFAGPPEQAKLLDTYLRALASAREMETALLAQFGDQSRGHPLFTESFAAMTDEVARSADKTLFLVAGERASLMSATPLYPSLCLRKFAGKWRVTHLDSYEYTRSQTEQVAAAYADSYANVAAGIKAGDLTSLDQAAAAAKEVDKKIAEITRETSRTRRVEPAPKAADWKAPSEADLRRMISQPINTSDAQALFAALPGLPTFSVTGPYASFHAPEAGLDLSVDPRTFKVRGVSCFAAGICGYAPYTGALPHGLKVDMPRAEVERLIGRPVETSDGTDTMPLSAYYPHLGVHVTYDYKLRDPKSPAWMIRLYEPEAAGPKATAAAPAAGPRLAFRLVATDKDAGPADALSEPAAPDKTIQVLRRVELDESHLAHAALTLMPNYRLGEPPSVALRLTPEGARRLTALSTANVGRRLAIVLDGQLLTCPVIRDPMAGDIVITLPNMTSHQVGQIAGRLHATLSALPPTPK